MGTALGTLGTRGTALGTRGLGATSSVVARATGPVELIKSFLQVEGVNLLATIEAPGSLLGVVGVSA